MKPRVLAAMAAVIAIAGLTYGYQPSIRSRWRRAGGFRDGRSVVNRIACWIRDAVWHHLAKFHHADLALSTFGGRGGHCLGA